MKNLLYGSASAFFIVAAIAIIIMLNRESKMIAKINYQDCLETELRVDSLAESIDRLIQADSLVRDREVRWRVSKYRN